MRRPEWLTEEPDHWPPEARLAYSILARAALRRLGAGPGAPDLGLPGAAALTPDTIPGPRRRRGR